MPESRIDLTEFADSIGQEVASAHLEVAGPAGVSPAVTLQALQVAIRHETALRAAAELYAVDSQQLLDALLDALQGPATSAPPASTEFTDAELAALAEAGVDLDGPEDEEQINVSARAVRVELDSLSTAEFARRSGVSPGRVRQRIKSGSLFATLRDGEWHLPSWQLQEGRPLLGLEKVVPCISRALHPLTVAALMTQSDPDLLIGSDPVSPAAWLASGGAPEAVCELLVSAPAAP